MDKMVVGSANPMDINTDLVRRLIDRQFPQWQRYPIQKIAPGGWDNRSFRLGSDLTVRLPSHSTYVAQVAKEQRWLPQLASRLAMAIPMPVAMGLPSDDYPWPWSVYRWIDGETARVAPIANLPRFATDLANFLKTLQAIDAAEGPLPGSHNFYRGGDLHVYHNETHNAIQSLNTCIDQAAATAVWQAALHKPFSDRPVWVHGDIASTNLLVQDSRLSAVIDFGCLGIGDPACDLTIAWTFFSGPSREAFRRHLEADAGTWARARGWAIWKALITMADARTDVPKRQEAQRVFNEVITEFAQR